MNRRRVKTENEALAIGRALRVTIPVARELGWSSERTFREAEAYAGGWDGRMMPLWRSGEVLR
jgi:hypothetical protein